MYGANLNDDVSVFVSGQQLSGIESADISYTHQQSNLKPLGTRGGITVVNGEPQKDFSFSRYLIYDDPILNYTGGNEMAGSINYQGSSYGFESGYLTNYSVNCAVGSIPKVNSQFFIADEMNVGNDASGSVFHEEIDIPRQGSISVSCDNSTTNRVIGFDYSITCEYLKYYTIGSSSISEVEKSPDVEYSASVQIDVDEAFLSNSESFLSNREDKEVSFVINGRGGTVLQSLVIPDASLVGESLNASADGSLILTLNYIGHGYR